MIIGSNTERWFAIKNTTKLEWNADILTSVPWLEVVPQRIQCRSYQEQEVKIHLTTQNISHEQLQNAGRGGFYLSLSSKISVVFDNYREDIEVCVKPRLPAPIYLSPSPVLHLTPSTVNFGELVRGQDKKLWLTFKNEGSSYLNAQVHNLTPWLHVIPRQLTCAGGTEARVSVHLNSKFITDAELQSTSTQGIFQLQPTNLSITSNSGTHTVEIQAKIKEPKPKARPRVQHRIASKAVGIIATILLIIVIARGVLFDPFKSFSINTAFNSSTANEAKLTHSEPLSQTASTIVTAPEPGNVKPITNTTTFTTASRKVPSIISVPSSIPATRSSVSNSQSVAQNRPSNCYSSNPIELLSPIDTTSNGAITFSWQWYGKLPKDCGFEVRVWRDGEPPKGVHDAVKDNLNGEIKRNSPNTYSLHVSNMQDTPSVQGHSGEYFWTVILVKLRPTYEETDLRANPQRFWLRLSSD